MQPFKMEEEEKKKPYWILYCVFVLTVIGPLSGSLKDVLQLYRWTLVPDCIWQLNGVSAEMLGGGHFDDLKSTKYNCFAIAKEILQCFVSVKTSLVLERE